MKAEAEQEAMSLVAMPGIMVILTVGYFFVMHLGHLWNAREGVEWTGAGFERHYLETGAAQVRGPLSRARAGLGLDANEVVARGGELFYLPDIAHVTGRSFLETARGPRHVVLQREGADSRVKDPLPAILDFDRQLRVRGVRLVLVPTPSKAMVARPGAPLHNEGFEDFLATMEAHEIPVFDPSQAFAEFQQGGQAAFLRTDSHWSPEAMRLAAILLAAFLEREGLVPEAPEESFRAGTREVTNAGDLAKLLDGGGRSRWQESIAVHPVTRVENRLDETSPWRPNPAAPLLLLGDSFTNVFSLEEMGWGAGGGFAEVLSQSLGFSIDRLARNADGAFASRQELQSLAGRLDDKSVVVWQFAARELSFGDWKQLEVPARGKPPAATLELGATELVGTIAAVAKVPSLTRTPYRHAVMEILLRDVRSPEEKLPGEVVLLGMGVEERVPTAMTRWKVGTKLTVKVVEWRSVQERYGRLPRLALDDPELEWIGAERFWIVE